MSAYIWHPNKKVSLREALTGRETSKTREECADMCSNNVDCKSFLHRPTRDKGEGEKCQQDQYGYCWLMGSSTFKDAHPKRYLTAFEKVTSFEKYENPLDKKANELENKIVTEKLRLPEAQFYEGNDGSVSCRTYCHKKGDMCLGGEKLNDRSPLACDDRVEEDMGCWCLPKGDPGDAISADGVACTAALNAEWDLREAYRSKGKYLDKEKLGSFQRCFVNEVYDLFPELPEEESDMVKMSFYRQSTDLRVTTDSDSYKKLWVDDDGPYKSCLRKNDLENLLCLGDPECLVAFRRGGV